MSTASLLLNSSLHKYIQPLRGTVLFRTTMGSARPCPRKYIDLSGPLTVTGFGDAGTTVLYINLELAGEQSAPRCGCTSAGLIAVNLPGLVAPVYRSGSHCSARPMRSVPAGPPTRRSLPTGLCSQACATATCLVDRCASTGLEARAGAVHQQHTEVAVPDDQRREF